MGGRRAENVQPERGCAKLKAILITKTNEETLKRVFTGRGKMEKQTSCACQEINDLFSLQPVSFCSFSTSEKKIKYQRDFSVKKEGFFTNLCRGRTML